MFAPAWTVDELRAKIEGLAPEQTKDREAALTLSDVGFALGARFSQVLGRDVPNPLPERDELGARCLELLRAWVPKLDAKTLKALEYRVADRKTPIDLKARKKQLKQGLLPDRTNELAPFGELPPLAGFEPIRALYCEGRLIIGELGEGPKVDARSGVWLAYFRDTHKEHEGDGDAPPQELVAVHADCLARVDELRAGMTKIKGRLPIHGASMAITDGLSMAKDKDLFDALAGNYEEDYKGRAAQVFLGGDGSAEAFVQYEDNRAVLVFVMMS